MSIFALSGDAGKCEARAHELRNEAITDRSGALIVRKDASETKPLLEKIIIGDEFVAGKAVGKIRWKPSPVIIFVNDGISRLNEIEILVPGFTEKFGPVKTVKL